MQESYNKRLNILVHGRKEDGNKVGETKETIAKFTNFVKEGLTIEDSNEIEYADIHRLPQHPVLRLGKKANRPIIVKLLAMQDKKKLYKLVKNLKAYNDRGKLEQTPHPCYVNLSDHFPQPFQNQRKLLLPHSK